MNEFDISVILVFEFNVWGMPGGIGDCQYKKERMRALANIIRSREPYFDIFMMAELWMEDDHALLMEAANETGLYMTGFRELASRYTLDPYGPHKLFRFVRHRFE